MIAIDESEPHTATAALLQEFCKTNLGLLPQQLEPSTKFLLQIISDYPPSHLGIENEVLEATATSGKRAKNDCRRRTHAKADFKRKRARTIPAKVRQQCDFRHRHANLPEWLGASVGMGKDACF